jgi:hypothetical protein
MKFKISKQVWNQKQGWYTSSGKCVGGSRRALAAANGTRILRVCLVVRSKWKKRVKI